MLPLRLLLAAALVAGALAPCSAGTGSVEIAASIRTVEDPFGILQGAIGPGDEISAVYTYDFATEDADDSPRVGEYWHASHPAGIRIVAGDVAFESDPLQAGFVVRVVDDEAGDTGDLYRITSYNQLPLRPGVLVDRIEWDLFDPSSSALESDALPHEAPDLERFVSEAGLTIRGCEEDEQGFCDFLRSFVVHADVTSAVWSTAATDCRFGNVNASGEGPVTDVLFVNGSPGENGGRSVELGPGAPIEVRVGAPPSRASAPFALYVWKGHPAGTTVRPLPFDVGRICMPIPLTDASPALLAHIANNLGRTDVLGEPDMPSTPAPSMVVDDPRGPTRPLRFFLQGIIADDAALGHRVSITNGIAVEIR